MKPRTEESIKANGRISGVIAGVAHEGLPPVPGKLCVGNIGQVGPRSTFEWIRPDKINKINIGGGGMYLEGYRDIDLAGGQVGYPLAEPPNSVDEIRASHVLEHWSHRLSLAVLMDWFKALKPGGTLKVAVPDFAKIVAAYSAQGDEPVEMYLMGGHTNDADTHGAIFTEAKLLALLHSAGFADVEPWPSDCGDCTSLPVSLGIQCRKPSQSTRKASNTPLNVAAVMSTPRLTFSDNMFCAAQALMPMGIPLRRCTGAFWGPCLTYTMMDTIKEFPNLDALLCLDYDTIYSTGDIEALVKLFLEHPEADAIAALQASRSLPAPLMATDGGIPSDSMSRELVPVKTAHFGCTLLRVASLRDAMPRPWFHGDPGEDGDWGADRTDPDIGFWHAWHAAGLKTFIAPRVHVGHAELMIRWLDHDLKPVWQIPVEYWDGLRLPEVWT